VSETEVAIRDVLRVLPTFMVIRYIFSSCVCLIIVNVVHISIINKQYLLS
jgi:hypothetical protein